MPTFLSCKTCGTIISTSSRDGSCAECRKRDQDDVDRVREYLKTHPTAKLDQVVAEAHVPVVSITRYLESGQLDGIPHNLGKPCRTCGTNIHSGKVCQDCMREIQRHIHDLKLTIEKKRDGGGDDDDGMFTKRTRGQ